MCFSCVCLANDTLRRIYRVEKISIDDKDREMVDAKDVILEDVLKVELDSMARTTERKGSSSSLSLQRRYIMA